jgi:transcriptional regulator with XRE-family HTH domain
MLKTSLIGGKIMIIESLKKAMERENLSLSDVANGTGLSRSTISRYMNNIVEIQFKSLLKIIRFTLPSHERGLVTTACKSFTKPINIKCAFEYFASYRYFEELTDYLTLHQKSSNKEIQEWVTVYEHILGSKEIPDVYCYEWLENLSKLDTSYLETTIYVKLMKATAYYYLNDFPSMLKETHQALKEVPNISNSFLQQSYYLGAYHFTRYYFLLSKRQINKSRECCDYIINHSFNEFKNASTYHVKGVSFLFEDYEQSLTNFHKAAQLFASSGSKPWTNEIHQRYMPLLKGFWNKHDEVNVEECVDSVRPYIEYKKGNQARALELLREFEESGKVDKEERPFYLFFLGLAQQDEMILWQSFSTFLMNGELFYAQLPASELQKDPKNEKLVTILFEAKEELTDQLLGQV